MKRIILFSMVFALLFSLFGCKTADYQDTAEVDTIVVDRKDKQPTEQSPKPQQLPETEEKNEAQTTEQPGTEDKDDEPDPEADKAAKCDVTIDMPFSANEIVVAFTLKESEKLIKYTPADFPQLDVFNVFEFNYYPIKYHPEYFGRTIVMLMLNNPSKERVLEYVKILEKDKRVYSAEPNFIVDIDEKDSNYCSVYLTAEELAKNKEYTVDDFSYPGIISVDDHIEEYIKRDTQEKIRKRWLDVTYDNSNNEPLKHLLGDEKVSSVIPHINGDGYYLDELEINIKNSDFANKKKYVIEDFPDIDVKSICCLESYPLMTMHLKQCSYRSLFEAYHKLKNDERFDGVSLSYIISISVPDEIYVPNN